MARARYSIELINLRKAVINTLDNSLTEHKHWTSFHENLEAFLRMTFNIPVDSVVKLGTPLEPEEPLPRHPSLDPPDPHKTEKSTATEPVEVPLPPPSAEDVEAVDREIRLKTVLAPEVPPHLPLLDDLNPSNEHDESDERGGHMAELPEVVRSPPPRLNLPNQEDETNERYVTIKTESLEEPTVMEWSQYKDENDDIDENFNPGPPPETPILPEDQNGHTEFNPNGRKLDQTEAPAAHTLARSSEDISSFGSWLLEGIYFGQEVPQVLPYRTEVPQEPKAKEKKRKRRSSCFGKIYENKRSYNPRRTVTTLRNYLRDWRPQIQSIAEEKICVKLRIKKWDKVFDDGVKFFNRLMAFTIPADQKLDNDMKSVKEQFEEEFPDVECYINECKEKAIHADNHYEVDNHRKYCCSACAETESLEYSSSLDISALFNVNT